MPKEPEEKPLRVRGSAAKGKRRSSKGQAVGAGVQSREAQRGMGVSNLTLCLRFAKVLLIFGSCAALTSFIWSTLPPKDESATFSIPPWSLEDARGLSLYMSKYVDAHFYNVIAAYVSLYLLLQSFSIPGSTSLSILAGALFPVPLAIVLVAFCAAAGASGAYMISRYVMGDLIQYYLEERLIEYRKVVDRNRSNLFFYMLFLRITPLVPNWFVNIACPNVHIPLSTFFFGSFVGVSFPSILWIRMGKTLNTSLQTNSLPLKDLFNLFLMGSISLIPVIWKDRFKSKMEGGLMKQKK